MTTSETTAPEAKAKTSKLRAAAIAFLAIGVLALVRNVFSTFASLDANPGAGFFELFFVTTDETGEVDGKLIAMTWAPFICLPLAGVFALLERVRKTR